MAARRRLLLPLVGALCLLGLSAAAAWACTPHASLVADAEEVRPGGAVALRGADWPEGGLVEVHMESAGQGGRELVHEATGPELTASVTIPEDAAEGTHYFLAKGFDESGEQVGEAAARVTVRHATADEDPPEGQDADDGAGDDGAIRDRADEEAASGDGGAGDEAGGEAGDGGPEPAAAEDGQHGGGAGGPRRDGDDAAGSDQPVGAGSTGQPDGEPAPDAADEGEAQPAAGAETQPADRVDPEAAPSAAEEEAEPVGGPASSRGGPLTPAASFDAPGPQPAERSAPDAGAGSSLAATGDLWGGLDGSATGAGLSPSHAPPSAGTSGPLLTVAGGAVAAGLVLLMAGALALAVRRLRPLPAQTDREP